MQQPELSGLYHLCAGGETSWHGYATHVIEWARQRGKSIRVAADQVLANPWADHTGLAAIAGWAWNLTNLRVPHAVTSPLKLADQLGELEYWAQKKYGREAADKQVAALGQAFDAEVGGAPRRFARLPDYTAVALDTGELFTLAQDESLPRPLGDSALPAEIVEAYPSEGDLVAKALWAYNAQYKKGRKSAGAAAARLEVRIPAIVTGDSGFNVTGDSDPS